MSKFYKAIQTKRFYVAVETFPVTAKRVSPVYKSGFRFFEAFDMKTYSIVAYRLRVMFGIKKSGVGERAQDDK